MRQFHGSFSDSAPCAHHSSDINTLFINEIFATEFFGVAFGFLLMQADREIAQGEAGEMEPADKYRAPALDKGLDILELLANEAEGLSRAEIVKAMGRSQSEIYRMLERLVARGYVTRDPGDRFALSMKLFVLATRHPHWRRLVSHAQPLMDAFAREMMQSCHLVIPERGTATVIAQASPVGTWEFRVKIGAQLDLLNSGSGQTLLAFQQEASLADTLAIWGIVDQIDLAKALFRDAAGIRAAGYRLAPSSQLIGVQDVSVPILTSSGQATAVITCPYIGRPAPDVVPSIDEARLHLCRVANDLALG